MVTILQGNVLDQLRALREQGRKVKCVVTSPPYWGLRDYGLPPTVWGGNPRCDHVWGADVRHTGGAGRQGATSQRKGRANVKAQETVREAGNFCEYCGAWRGCHGLEPTPELFVEHEVQIFSLVWEILDDDGTLWLNLGDGYAGSWGAQSRANTTDANEIASTLEGASMLSARQMAAAPKSACTGSLKRTPGLKNKDLIGVPWRVALALQASGWYLRSDIIWSKPNPMPESVRDRPTKAHEYLFLFSKQEDYYYDQEAVLEPVSEGTHARLAQNIAAQIGSERAHAGEKTNGNMKAVARGSARKLAAGSGTKNNDSFDEAMAIMPDLRNKRTVWTVPTYSYKGAHFATFPPDLIKPCILAGTKPGETVLDPFGGSGTTGQVAIELGREAILIELNTAYVELIRQRTTTTVGLALTT